MYQLDKKSGSKDRCIHVNVVNVSNCSNLVLICVSVHPKISNALRLIFVEYFSIEKYKTFLFFGSLTTNPTYEKYFECTHIKKNKARPK